MCGLTCLNPGNGSVCGLTCASGDKPTNPEENYVVNVN